MSALDGKALLEHGEVIARRYAARVGTDVAEELRAEAVLRALRSPAPDGRVEPWLERIYKNLLIDRWRRADAVTVELDHVATPASSEATPEERLLARERRRLVRAGLRRLPREARQVLLSRYYDELDESATANRFGIAGATVRTRVHRALARMRVWLGDLKAILLPVGNRLAGQLGMVGAAPVLVAMLIAGGANAPEPAPMVIAAAPAMELSSAALFVRAETHPGVQERVAATHVRLTKRAPAAQPPLPPVVESAPPVVTEIQWPEPLDVFAEPEKQALPCLVEAPATFALQIEEMVDDEL